MRRKEMQIYHPPSFPTIDCNLQVIIMITNNHSYESQIFRKENQISWQISMINSTRKEKGICVTLKAWRALHPMSCRVLCKTGRVYLNASFPFFFPLFSSSSTTTMYRTFPTSVVIFPFFSPSLQSKHKYSEQPNSSFLFLENQKEI